VEQRRPKLGTYYKDGTETGKGNTIGEGTPLWLCAVCDICVNECLSGIEYPSQCPDDLIGPEVGADGEGQEGEGAEGSIQSDVVLPAMVVRQIAICTRRQNGCRGNSV
jgi:hypothetical protein